jgi:hypothetical protein
MKFEKRQKSNSYLHGILLDGAKPFLYRSGIRTLLGIPETGMESRIFTIPSLRAGFGYVNHSSQYSRRNAGSSYPYKGNNNNINEADEEILHEPVSGRGDFSIDREKSAGHPHALQNETGYKNSAGDEAAISPAFFNKAAKFRASEEANEVSLSHESGAESKDIPPPLKKIEKLWEPSSIIFQNKNSISTDRPGAGEDQPGVPVNPINRQGKEISLQTINEPGRSRDVFTGIQKHPQGNDLGMQANKDILSDVTISETIKNGKQGAQAHIDIIPHARPERHFDGISAGKSPEQIQPSRSFSGPTAFRSFDEYEAGEGEPDKRSDFTSSIHHGHPDHNAFKLIDTVETDRILRIRQAVQNQASGKFYENTGKNNETMEEQTQRIQNNPFKKTIIAKGRPYRLGISTVFWERNYLGHFHLRPLR